MEVPQTAYSSPSYFQLLPTIDFRNGDQRGIRLQSVLHQNRAIPDAWHLRRWTDASMDEIGQKVTIRVNVCACYLHVDACTYTCNTVAWV